MDQKEYDFRNALDTIPKRILDLLLEIDQLKVRYVETRKEYEKYIWEKEKKIMRGLERKHEFPL